MKQLVLGVVVASAAIVLVGCGGSRWSLLWGENNVVETGDTVKVDYIGSLDDGTVFDTSLEAKAKETGLYDEVRPYEPLVVNVWKGEVIPGFDQALVGMKVDETKTFTIPVDQAYGEPKEELVQQVPLATFQESWLTPEAGKTYNFGIAQWTIKAVSETGVTIDFNHPLAGQTLTFEITVREIISPDETTNA